MGSRNASGKTPPRTDKQKKQKKQQQHEQTKKKKKQQLAFPFLNSATSLHPRIIYLPLNTTPPTTPRIQKTQQLN